MPSVINEAEEPQPSQDGGDVPMADAEPEPEAADTTPNGVDKDVKLEELFSDADSDEEFPSSNAAPPASSQDVPSSLEYAFP